VNAPGIAVEATIASAVEPSDNTTLSPEMISCDDVHAAVLAPADCDKGYDRRSACGCRHAGSGNRGPQKASTVGQLIGKRRAAAARARWLPVAARRRAWDRRHRRRRERTDAGANPCPRQFRARRATATCDLNGAKAAAPAKTNAVFTGQSVRVPTKSVRSLIAGSEPPQRRSGRLAAGEEMIALSPPRPGLEPDDGECWKKAIKAPRRLLDYEWPGSFGCLRGAARLEHWRSSSSMPGLPHIMMRSVLRSSGGWWISLNNWSEPIRSVMRPRCGTAARHRRVIEISRQ